MVFIANHNFVIIINYIFLSREDVLLCVFDSGTCATKHEDLLLC